MALKPTQPPVEPQEIYASDGVDISLVRWMLSLNPAERLEVLQSAANSLARMTNAAKR